MEVGPTYFSVVVQLWAGGNSSRENFAIFIATYYTLSGIMATSTRNIAIVRRHAASRPTTPGSNLELEELQPRDIRYILQAVAWNKCVEAYLCERGMVAIRTYIALRSGVDRNNRTAIVLSQIFLGFLRSTSPLLVDDGTFDNPRIVSEHPRGTWSGNYNDFDIRAQAVKVNSTVRP